MYRGRRAHSAARNAGKARERGKTATTMNCSERDQDILLMEHGALGGVRRWSTERHLRHCPRCQERREQHSRVSRLVGATVREAGPDLRVLYGGAASAAVTAAAAAGAGRNIVGAGRGRLRPVQPLIRPAFVGAWAAVATIVAAGAWIYKATALAPGYEHMATPAPAIRRPARPSGPRQSVVPPSARAAEVASARARPSGFTTRVASAAAPSSSSAATPPPSLACPSGRGVGPLQQAALLPPPPLPAAAAAAPPRREDVTGTAASSAAPPPCPR